MALKKNIFLNHKYLSGIGIDKKISVFISNLLQPDQSF